LKTDHIIVGQGICGSFLGHYLGKAGRDVIVIDQPRPFSASRVASGVINPVTGRRLVRTWMIEDLMPFAVSAYGEWGTCLNAELIRRCPILDFHSTPQMKLAFDSALEREADYLAKPEDQNAWSDYFNPAFGIGEIKSSWLVDMPVLLEGYRKELQQQQLLLEESFDASGLVLKDHAIQYRGITARSVIFCDGVQGFDNPFFSRLPFTHMKGEALIIDIPGLPRDYIFKQGINIVPWRDGLFWVGSSYEWEFTDPGPTETFRLRTEAQLAQWLKLPYTVTDHFAAGRPANIERRPFVGFHPSFPCVGILNGMGAKGCTLAPYFAHQLAEHIVHQTPIHPLADVRRFSRILG